MKNFIITWFCKKDNKYLTNKITRSNKIQCNKVDNVMNIFMKDFGNLKDNEIISIQEVDKDNNFIGEPIVPE